MSAEVNKSDRGGAGGRRHELRLYGLKLCFIIHSRSSTIQSAGIYGNWIPTRFFDAGDFPEELQLTPAAYELLAQDIEPIIAVRIEAVGAPPQP